MSELTKAELDALAENCLGGDTKLDVEETMILARAYRAAARREAVYREALAQIEDRTTIVPGLGSGYYGHAAKIAKEALKRAGGGDSGNG